MLIIRAARRLQTHTNVFNRLQTLFDLTDDMIPYCEHKWIEISNKKSIRGCEKCRIIEGADKKPLGIKEFNRIAREEPKTYEAIRFFMSSL